MLDYETPSPFYFLRRFVYSPVSFLRGRQSTELSMVGYIFIIAEPRRLKNWECMVSWGYIVK